MVCGQCELCPRALRYPSGGFWRNTLQIDYLSIRTSRKTYLIRVCLHLPVLRQVFLLIGRRVIYVTTYPNYKHYHSFLITFYDGVGVIFSLNDGRMASCTSRLLLLRILLGDVNLVKVLIETNKKQLLLLLLDRN